MGVNKKTQGLVKFLIYLIVVVLINMAGNTMFLRMDLTENGVYSISKASKEVVSTLSEPLTINVFFTKNLPAPYNSTEKYLHDLLKEYAISSNKYFNYKFFDVDPDEGNITQEATENRKLAKNYGIFPVQVQNIEKDQVKLQKAYMGLVIIHGDIIEKIPTITSTDKLEYKLTTTIRKLNNKISALLSLSEKIKVKLFFSTALNDVAPAMRLEDLPKMAMEIEKIVGEVNAKVYDKLKFKLYDPSKDSSLVSELNKYNIMKLKWPDLSKGKIKAGEGYIGLVMEYEEKSITIPLMNIVDMPYFGPQYTTIEMAMMSEILNNNLEALIDINEDIGYLSDLGTPNISRPTPLPHQRKPQDMEAVSSFKTAVSKNYSIKEFKFTDGDKIPDSFNCLIIAGPKDKFFDHELYQLDQFLMKGKNLALFIDSFDEIQRPREETMGMGPAVSYKKIDSGLEKLLSHYGVSVNKNYIMDKACFMQKTIDQNTGQRTGEQPIYFAPVIKNKLINKDHLVLKNIKELITLKISSIELDEKRIKENQLDAYKLFSSSEDSWEMSKYINLSPMAVQPPVDKDFFKSRPLAYLIEGEFPSYFAGKPVPIKKAKKDEKDGDKDNIKEDENNNDKKSEADKELTKIKGVGETIIKGKPGKIFLIGSSQLLKDNMFDAEGEGPNATFIMNIMDHLNNRDEVAIMRSKLQTINPLEESTGGMKSFVKTFNIGGLPIIVVIFGLFVLLRRISKKKRIQEMFQK